MSEFLPGPSWRERARPDTRWIVVLFTFCIVAGIGFVMLYGAARALEWAGAARWVEFALWMVPAILVAIWALRAPQPATASDHEAQGWTEYVLRSVMIGVDRPRAAPWRIITAILFGPPLVGFGIIYLVLSLTGIV